MYENSVDLQGLGKLSDYSTKYSSEYVIKCLLSLVIYTSTFLNLQDKLKSHANAPLKFA